MSALSLATARSGEILDWSPADKAALIVFAPFLGLIVALARVYQLLAEPEVEPYIDRSWLVWVARALEIDIAFTVAFTVVWLVVRKKAPTSRLFVDATLVVWLTALASGAYLIGHVSTPIFGGLLAVVCALLLFFELRQALALAAYGIAAFFIPLGLIAFGLIPYGPVFRAAPFVGQRTSMMWIASTSMFAFAIAVVPTLLLAGVVRRWRSRDASLFEIARLDMLTQVANRRYFFDRLLVELERARRHDSPIALLLLDLDHFKRVNDQHGHLVGDLVLVHVTELLQKHVLRRADLIGRYGGEEFAIILPETDLEGARTVAERCRATVEAFPCKLSDGTVIPLTISIGVATPGVEFDADELVQRVDTALYVAKEEGRNRVSLADPVV